MSCSICLSDSEISVRCPNSPGDHFFCKECFGEFVGQARTAHMSYWKKTGGKLACPICNVGIFEEKTVYENTTFEEWTIYSNAIRDYNVALKIKTIEDQTMSLSAQTKHEIETRIHTDFIRENILTLRCPECDSPFDDFSGCLALTCGSCKSGFCALCVKTPGEKNTTHAHLHVKTCKYNPSKGELFMSKGQFIISRNVRYSDMVIERLLLISNIKIRLDVAKNIIKDLRDLGVTTDLVDNIIKNNGEHVTIKNKKKSMEDGVVGVGAAVFRVYDLQKQRRVNDTLRQITEVENAIAELNKRLKDKRDDVTRRCTEYKRNPSEDNLRDKIFEINTVRDIIGEIHLESERLIALRIRHTHFTDTVLRFQCVRIGCRERKEFRARGEDLCFKHTKLALGMSKNSRRTSCVPNGATIIV